MGIENDKVLSLNAIFLNDRRNRSYLCCSFFREVYVFVLPLLAIRGNEQDLVVRAGGVVWKDQVEGLVESNRVFFEAGDQVNAVLVQTWLRLVIINGEERHRYDEGEN